MPDPTLFVVTMPLADLTPYPDNPRLNDEAVARVARSLDTFGWRQPLVVDEQHVILAGHTRYLAALFLGWTEAPVHVAVGLTPVQARAYRIADNRAGEEAEWDVLLLAQELRTLREHGADLETTGFTTEEFTRFLDLAITRAEIQPPGPAEPVTVECPHCSHAFVRP